MEKDKDHSFVSEIDTGFWNKDGKIFVCSCGSEALAIEFPIEDGKSWDGDFCNMAIWEHGTSRYNWWWKLKLCWSIFKYGVPYSDSICFTKYQTKQIKKLLEQHLNNKKITKGELC